MSFQTLRKWLLLIDVPLKNLVSAYSKLFYYQFADSMNYKNTDFQSFKSLFLEIGSTFSKLKSQFANSGTLEIKKGIYNEKNNSPGIRSWSKVSYIIAVHKLTFITSINNRV